MQKKQQQKKGGFDFFGLFKSEEKQPGTVATVGQQPATLTEQKVEASGNPAANNSLWGGKSKRRRNKKRQNKSKKQRKQ